MQEFLIVMSIILGIFFWLLGVRGQNWSLIAIGGTFFLFLAIGLFSTGYDRYEGDATFVEVGDTTTATMVSKNFPATIAENITLYLFAQILLILSFILYFSSFKTFRFVRLAQNSEADNVD